MPKSKITPVRIGQIETGTEIIKGMIWTLSEVAVTCQKTGFEHIVKSAGEALKVATEYAATQENGYVYRAALPTVYEQSLSHLPRS